MYFRISGALVVVGLVLTAVPRVASASPVLCPGPAFNDAERQFTVTTSSGAAQCVSWGTGNIKGEDDEIGLGWTFLDKDSTIAEDPEVFVISGAKQTSGEFRIAPLIWAQYSEVAIAFKTGNNLNPSWAAFALPVGTLSGAWDISSNGLSHANLYVSGFLGDETGPILSTGSDGHTVPQTAPIGTPEPASLALLGAGLFAMRSAFRRRRSRSRE